MEFGPYLCYQFDFLLAFFTEDRSYQYLQDVTSFAFLSDKSTEIFKWKYSKIWNSPYWLPGQHGAPCSYANEAVMSSSAI